VDHFPARCIAPGCANPYVTRYALGADEVVPLCLTHAKQATETDAPADRLRSLAQAASRPDPRRQRPAWQQRPLLARVASNFFYENPELFRLGPVTCIGFDRGEEGNLLLTLRMPTTSDQPKAAITNNVWDVLPDGAEVVCPPSGRVLDISYPDGDRFRIEFTDVHSAAALQMRFGNIARWAYRVTFPCTYVEVSATVANTDLDFGPSHCAFDGPGTKDCFTSHGGPAYEVRLAPDQLDLLFPKPPN
jgi:hypothetical protein